MYVYFVCAGYSRKITFVGSSVGRAYGVKILVHHIVRNFVILDVRTTAHSKLIFILVTINGILIFNLDQLYMTLFFVNIPYLILDEY